MMVWAVSLSSAELSPDVLTAVVPHDSIRSLSRVGTLTTPQSETELYPYHATVRR